MSKKDNVIQFPTKANVPETLTISFGDSDPVNYTLSPNNIDLSGIDGTISVNLSDYENFKSMTKDSYNLSYSDTFTITVTDPVEMLEAEMEKQLSLDLDED